MRGWAWMVGLIVLGCGGDRAKAGTGGDGSTNAGSGAGEVSSGGANGGAVSAGGSSVGGSSVGGSGVASAGASAGVAGGGPGEVYAPTFTEREGCRPKGPTLEQIPGARLVKAAGGIDDIDSLLLLDGSLYFAIRRDIFRLAPPTAAAATAQLVADADPTIWALFGGGGALYSVNTNFRQLWRTSLASLPAEPELIAEDVSETGMLADEKNLYFSASNGGIHVLPFTAAAPGAVPTELVPTVKSLSLAAADGYLYYIDYQSVYRVPVTGGAPELQFSVGSPRSLAVDNGVVYVAAGESVLRWTPSTNLAYTILATGSRLSETSQYNNDVEWLKVIGDRVYYREDDGTFAWVKTDASDCRIIVKLEDNGFQNQQYAVTDTHYYVIVDDTELYEIPR